MSTALITKLRRSMSEMGVETVLTLAFVAKLAAGTSVAHAMVAHVVGHESSESVVVFADAPRSVEVTRVMGPADVAELRALARSHSASVVAARAAARAHARRDSMLRVTVVGPDGRVERRVVETRER